MNFETGDLYHIYNQGNNKNKVFYSRENYLFFLNKLKGHILPYADILAWCLMPNHFHLMVYVYTLEIEVIENIESANNIGAGIDIGNATLSHTSNKVETFNKSIGILLASYTRAINKQENRTGSLFRVHTHAECLTTPDLHTPSFFNTPDGTVINRHLAEEEYPVLCFNYIHQNPVKAGLVRNAEDWEFSSYTDYCGLRDGKLINRKRAEEFGLAV